ncbi:MAG: FecR family protein [Pseudomonadales bacterium]
MSEQDDSQNHPMNEQQLARLLQQVGKRQSPPTGVEADVRQAVKAAWRQEVDRRQSFRVRGLAIAASILVTMAAGWYLLVPAPAPEAIAVVETAIGQVQYLDADGNWQPLDPARGLDATSLRTERDSFVNLKLATGSNVRIDQDSSIRLDSTQRISLAAGAVYIDSNAKADANVDIHTRYGVAREIGTRFEVRLVPNAWRVQVRDGRVRVSNDRIDQVAAAGERIQMSAENRLTFSTVPANDPSWQWAQRAAAPFRIEGASLHDYLTWVAHETGEALLYDSPQAEQQADRTILHGSIAGLTPRESLDVVLATTDFRRVSSNAITITIAR